MYISIYIYICVYMFMNTYHMDRQANDTHRYMLMFTIVFLIGIETYTYIHMRICIFLCIYLYIYISIYTYIHMCMYVHILCLYDPEPASLSPHTPARPKREVARALGGEVYEFDGGHEVPLDEVPGVSVSS